MNNRAQERKLLLPHPAAFVPSADVEIHKKLGSVRSTDSEPLVIEVPVWAGLGSRFSPAAFLLQSQEVSASTNCA